MERELISKTPYPVSFSSLKLIMKRFEKRTPTVGYRQVPGSITQAHLNAHPLT